MGKYNPKETEKEILKYWEENKVYKFNSDIKDKIYSVDTPPPTVSGKMHIGHAFGYIQHDSSIRYRRMKGYNVFFPFGTDDNGLPTERLVEKKKKVKGSRMPRDEFIELCNSFLKETRDDFIKDWKDIGISADYSLSMSTIDENSRKISQESFIDLYNDGSEYRKKAPTMWCPTCATAISQVELEDKDVDSVFNDIIFKVKEDDGTQKDLVVATTRPELLPACVAIFVNPEDDRYSHLAGKVATSPHFNVEVPIILDEKADPNKGTGVVMCCTFGDQTDIEWYKKHNLPLKVAISKNGKMTSIANEFEGLKIKEAREKIIETLKEENLLINQKPIKHAVNVHERCGTEIEILDSEQWFIKYLDLKENFLEIGEELNWIPFHLKNRFDNWVKGLQWDWCISRQRFFGVPFPVWYCDECNEVILAEKKDLPVDPSVDKPPVKACPKCGSKKFRAEKDVLDTWATSSLTPDIYRSLVKNTPSENGIFPFSLRFQGHDIISFWLFNTVAKSKMHHDSKPWEDVAINGWVLDPKGKKMSKSKGNVVDPRKYLEKYSADMMRFWASSYRIGDDVPFKENEFVAGKKTITKLWNASKFVFMNVDTSEINTLFDYSMDFENLSEHNKWIVSKYEDTLKELSLSFENYEGFKAKAKWERFFWTYFCDNYLEMIKDMFFNPENYSEKEVLETKKVVFTILFRINQMIAPILSFVTDKLFIEYFKGISEDFNEKSIHLTQIPEYNEKISSNDYVVNADKLIELMSSVRKYKNQNKMSLKDVLDEVSVVSDKEFVDFVSKFENILKTTLKISNLKFETISKHEASHMNGGFEIKVKKGD